MRLLAGCPETKEILILNTYSYSKFFEKNTKKIIPCKFESVLKVM